MGACRRCKARFGLGIDLSKWSLHLSFTKTMGEEKKMRNLGRSRVVNAAAHVVLIRLFAIIHRDTTARSP